ncbi:unnamed protein product [Darwinula stevensoni]|uniref:Uncharacterized protein n=1 Tax=Darwinula stevensoni TaxID=69355 RepID=A0A7R8X2U3_9CRUS|nr:unnamed protein product [Darwinula stevensoni]CAG0884306.1 unnamed protein product [Darwinula stevensoni]
MDYPPMMLPKTCAMLPVARLVVPPALLPVGSPVVPPALLPVGYSVVPPAIPPVPPPSSPILPSFTGVSRLLLSDLLITFEIPPRYHSNPDQLTFDKRLEIVGKDKLDSILEDQLAGAIRFPVIEGLARQRRIVLCACGLAFLKAGSDIR